MFLSTDIPDTDALVAATRAFVRTVSPITEPTVTVEKVVGEFARVRVAAPDGSTGPAFVFLKKAQGQWQGLDLGTGFDTAYFEQKGIPAALRL